MKLSEAIRLGSMWSEQAFLELQTEDKATCALGAAALALGVDPTANVDMRYAVLKARYPMLSDSARCPACNYIQGIWRRFRNHETDYEDVIIHLNDDHKWSRERIADWIAIYEPFTIFSFEIPHVEKEMTNV